MRLSFSSACSRARVDDGRPITNGIIMCGKTTTSRSGTIGQGFVDFQRGFHKVQLSALRLPAFRREPAGGSYPAFSISVIGLSFAMTTSRVIVTSRTFFWFGT